MIFDGIASFRTASAFTTEKLIISSFLSLRYNNPMQRHGYVRAEIHFNKLMTDRQMAGGLQEAHVSNVHERAVICIGT